MINFEIINLPSWLQIVFVCVHGVTALIRLATATQRALRQRRVIRRRQRSIHQTSGHVERPRHGGDVTEAT